MYDKISFFFGVGYGMIIGSILSTIIVNVIWYRYNNSSMNDNSS